MATGAEHEVPPPAAMMGLITGYWVSQAVGVVALLGVADQLGQGPRGSDELARAVGADPQALYRVLRLLASLGVFAEVAPRTFGLTPLGETLRSDAPDSVRNFAITETAPGHWLPWGRLHESVRSGRPMAREALGMELFDWYAQNPEEAGFFNAAMGNLSALAASELVRVYDFSAVRTVADVGGAHGVLLAAVLRANPAARGILFDLPHVIATAGERHRGAGAVGALRAGERGLLRGGAGGGRSAPAQADRPRLGRRAGDAAAAELPSRARPERASCCWSRWSSRRTIGRARRRRWT